MVQNNQLDDHTINMLVIILKKAMDKISATIKENKMIETIQAIENFDKQKAEQAKKDAKTGIQRVSKNILKLLPKISKKTCIPIYSDKKTYGFKYYTKLTDDKIQNHEEVI